MLHVLGVSDGPRYVGLPNPSGPRYIGVRGFMLAEGWSEVASAPTVVPDGGMIHTRPVCAPTARRPPEWAVGRGEEVIVREQAGMVCVSRRQEIAPESGLFHIEGLAPSDTVVFFYYGSGGSISVAATDFEMAPRYR